jgi:penicillin amidase
MLEEKEKYGIEDFKAMITDQHSFYAGILTPYILKLSSGQQEMSQAEQAAMNLLKEWDYEMNAGSAAPSVFEFFRKCLSKNLLADELEELFVQVPERISDYYIYKILKTGQDEWVDDVTTPQAESLEDIIKKSYSDCIKKLTEDYGEDLSDWTWGKIHKITLEHPMGKVKILDKAFGLNSDNYSIGGSNHTVCPYSYVDGFRVTDGASERHIYNTANWDESYTVIPTGASGVPSSEFYLSQTETYLDGKFYKDSFSERAVKASAKYTLMLKPAN